MPRFVTDSRPISAQHPLTEFYREEFVKHHRCLQQQRPYYSESAITDVEAALTTIMGQLEQLSTQDNAPQVVSSLLKKFDVVTGLSAWSDPKQHTLTRSLADLRHDLLAIVRAGIAAVDAGRARRARARAMARQARREGFSGATVVRVIAAGKAAPAMAAAAARRPRRRASAPASSSRRRGRRVPAGIRADRRRTSGADRRQRARPAAARSRSPHRCGADETLLVLLSGGASALMAVPADGVTLDDKRATTDAAAARGRRHPRAQHGAQASVGDQGRLARGARRRRRAARSSISDVVGDDLSVIASGPTVADASRFADALDVLRRFGGDAALSGGGRRATAARRARRRCPKRRSRATRGWRARRRRVIGVAARRDGGRGCRGRGASAITSLRIDDPSSARRGRRRRRTCARVLARAADVGRPACVVSSGETTVHVTGSGKGGRNQEFALAAADAAGVGRRAGGRSPASGTDGIDGPTDAAGAHGRFDDARRAPRAAGLAPDRFLADNNAYAFFDALGDLIHTGPTGTNVGDLQVILLA